MAESKGLFDDYMRRTLERQELERLSQEIRAAVAPFNPGDIFIATESMLKRRSLHISCRNWPSMDAVIDISRLDVLRYPEDSYLHVIGMVVKHFKNMEYLPPESQFELGEN